jgi:hypothetical protein
MAPTATVAESPLAGVFGAVKVHHAYMSVVAAPPDTAFMSEA